MKHAQNIKSKALFLLIIFNTNVAIGSIEIKQDWGEGTANFSNAHPLNNGNGKYDHWQSIGRVKINNGLTCSGTLIDTRSTTDEQDGPAYVLTSGHCTNLNDDKVLENVDTTGQVIFNYFQDTIESSKPYQVIRINWSTIRGQDISILQLDQTIGQLISDGVRPLKLASKLPVEDDVLIVGAPQSSHVQRIACPREESTSVIEGSWAWHEQIVSRCLDVVGGISGSPLLGRYNNEILAVVGTTTWGSGQSVCFRGSPCEVVEGQVNKKPGTNYATQATGLLECFDGGQFNRQNTACPLGPAFTFATMLPTDLHIKLERDSSGQVIPWLWTQTFEVDRPFYRYKFTRTLEECAVTSGYSEAFKSNTSGHNEWRRELRDGAGMYLLCIIGQDQKSVAPGPFDARNAKIHWRWMMEEPNEFIPVYSINGPYESFFYVIRAYPATPYLDAYKYQYKAGPSGETDCLDEQEYKEVPGSIGTFVVNVEGGPMKVCLKTEDMAGNPSPVAEFQLPE
ncbi:trypsin-like serine peptidase [Pseudomonas laurylsulfatiphila]|uniref:trypsin-like serine peptidase n=1 Tax=Pseudomonas laurylsulfatiphila TaxID=2011015 RepID=UPI003D1DFBFA|nr:hypothetical protein [Pseudomonas reinekei]